MALRAPSLFLYGFSIDANNQYIDFNAASLGPTLTATLPVGDYTLSDLLTAVAAALNLADPANVYSTTVDRTIAGGLQNRVTITSNGAYFSILFMSGPHSASTPAGLLGFPSTDQTGATRYTGNASAGTSLVTVYPGHNWLPVTRKQEVQGNVNISASGDKEAIVFQVQLFAMVDFTHEPITKAETAWLDFFEWAIQQKPFEFTPEYPFPGVFIPVTLESTESSSQGLGFEMKEMLPNFPGLTQTGKLEFRQIITASQFI